MVGSSVLSWPSPIGYSRRYDEEGSLGRDVVWSAENSDVLMYSHLKENVYLMSGST